MLIINADDFGKTASVNEAIERSFRHGWITQTTLMVNMPFADDAVARAKANGFAERIGFHLNLDEGCPLTEKIRRRQIFCDENGVFKKDILHKNLFWNGLSQEDKAALHDEIAAQVGKYVGYGLPLMHCDGHHHIHRAWCVLPVLLPILRQCGFKSIRRPNNITMRLTAWRHLAMRYRAYSWLTKKRMVHAGYRLVDWFGDFQDCRMMRRLPGGSVEVMVHPDMEAGKVVDYFLPLADEHEIIVKKFSGRNC